MIIDTSKQHVRENLLASMYQPAIRQNPWRGVGALLGIITATLALPTAIWIFAGAEAALVLTLSAIAIRWWLNYCKHQQNK